MNESLAERITRHRAVESWLLHQLARIREDLARLETEAAALEARRPALPPPDWVIETIRTGRGPQPFRVHRGDCPQGGGKPISRDEARRLLAGGTEPCPFCCPDVELQVDGSA
ncbi:DUF6233 domain-containing protein [Streptomyces sp. NPDC088748]|uniref:DUF6233 domain-containing protein n=1 Tax=Streptomyces sp. NPDC088748 TaxID=3365887 RepID=UPI00381D4CFC